MSGSPKYLLGVLCAFNVVVAFDRQIIAVVGEVLRKDWGLADKQVGALFGAFMFAYALSGIVFGRLADRISRVRILTVGVAAWSVLTAAGGWAQTFAQLIAIRILVGVGESTFFPVTGSILGDVFPMGRRARAMSIVMVGIPIGITLASVLGGAITAKAGWRAAFYIAIGPGLLCSIAAALVTEPRRGGAEAHAIGARRREGNPVWILLSIPSYRNILAGSVLFMFARFSIAPFLSVVLMRYHGMTVKQAGVAMGLAMGIAPVVGVILGGAAGDRMAKRRGDGAMLVMAIALLAAAPLYLLVFRLHPAQATLFVVLVAVSQIFVFPVIALIQSVVQDIVEPSLRGTAIAIQSLAGSVLGGALGPVVVGVLSDALAKRAARQTGLSSLSEAALEPFRPAALQTALCIIVPAVLAVVGTLFLLWCARMREDVAGLQQWMGREVEKERERVEPSKHRLSERERAEDEIAERKRTEAAAEQSMRLADSVKRAEALDRALAAEREARTAERTTLEAELAQSRKELQEAKCALEAAERDAVRDALARDAALSDLQLRHAKERERIEKEHQSALVKARGEAGGEAPDGADGR